MDFNKFQVSDVTLTKVDVQSSSFSFVYDIDGFENTVTIEYAHDLLRHDRLNPEGSGDALMTFACNLAAVSITRLGAALPKRFHFGNFEAFIAPEVIPFLKQVIPRKWSEHRFQVEQLDYQHPEFVYDEQVLGSRAVSPIFSLPEHTEKQKVFVASGSGKDSLLCSLLIKNAGIPHDLVTYLFDLYGDLEEQEQIFSRINNELAHENCHVLRYLDDFYPWLEQRMVDCGIPKRVNAYDVEKPFRTEAGEVFFMSMALVPLQIVFDAPIQLFGNEKSADAPNLVFSSTQEPIAHQWAKSIHGETALSEFYRTLFDGIDRISLTKALHDVRIFETLFRIGADLPYQTNSCNIQKPWCCRCEKCTYVFAGFSAFGEHEKVVEAFGQDLFQEPEVTRIWEELLGLHGYIPWECVGQPDEVQLYIYMAICKGINGIPMELFKQHFSNGATPSFENVVEKYGRIYDDHHRMPEWLWSSIRKVVGDEPIEVPSL